MWTEKARADVEADILASRTTYDPEVEQAITRLYERWLDPCCRHAEKWIRAQLDRGYALDNLEKFRQCCQEARDILERRRFYDRVRAARLSGRAEEGW